MGSSSSNNAKYNNSLQKENSGLLGRDSASMGVCIPTFWKHNDPSGTSELSNPWNSITFQKTWISYNTNVWTTNLAALEMTNDTVHMLTFLHTYSQFVGGW